jgi:Integrase core domain
MAGRVNAGVVPIHPALKDEGFLKFVTSVRKGPLFTDLAPDHFGSRGGTGAKILSQSPRSPWQNGLAERLIGSIRRECLDHVVVFGERHLRYILLSYMKYYNEVCTHLSLEKDTPVLRAVERTGHILRRPVLGGLHHQYIRV